jgi:hypothetical protein
MTLVCLFGHRDEPLLIGDTMLSSKEAGTANIDFPTLRRKRLRASNAKAPYTVPALTQKIVEITRNLYLGWAGPFYYAVDVINFLIEKCNGETPSQEKLTAISEEINRWKHPDLELVIVCSYGDRWQPFMGNVGILPHPDLGQIIILGSGTKDFLNHLGRNRFRSVDSDSSMRPANADTIHYALQFMLKAMYQQREFDYGLDKRWGSALEILVLRNGLEKVGGILYQTYRYKAGKNGPVIKPFSNKIFAFYHDADLIVETYSSRDGLLEYVIPPPQKIALGLPSSTNIKRPSSSQLVVTTLINVDDWGKIQTFVEWSADGSPHAMLNLSQEGNGTIKFDSDQVIRYYQQIGKWQNY